MGAPEPVEPEPAGGSDRTRRTVGNLPRGQRIAARRFRGAAQLAAYNCRQGQDRCRRRGKERNQRLFPAHELRGAATGISGGSGETDRTAPVGVSIHNAEDALTRLVVSG